MVGERPTEYIDWQKGKKLFFPKLKPTMKSFSIRITEYFLLQLKTDDNKLDIPYQSLMKILLQKALEQNQFHISK